MADIPLDQYQDQTPFGLYSHAAETAAALPQAKGTPEQFKGMLLKQGVKPAEIENSNYDATFADRPSVTKDELAQHFRQSIPKLSETLFSKEPKYANYATAPSRYHNYTIPGGENYREVVIRKPVPTKRVGVLSNGETLSEEELQNPIVRRTAEKVGLVMEDRPIDEEDAYKHGHWPGVRNPIAHIRMSDRQGQNGEKILHVEELQSDWGQEGRSSGFMDPQKKKEYEDHMREYRALGDKAEELAKATEEQLGIKSPEYSQIVELFPEMEQISKRMNHLYMNEPDKPMGKPYHPYVASTGAWTDLALKKVLHEAAHGGYDKVVFTPGEEQANRFDLSNHLSRIVATPSRDGLIHLDLHDHESPEDPFETISDVHPRELEKHVGKELADRIMKEIKFPEDHKVWRIESKVRDMKTGTTPSFERINEILDQYPEHIRNTLEIVPVMEKRGGKQADLQGLDLKVGGEGMKGFYDRIVPKQLNDMVKRHDPSVKMRHDTIDTERGPQPVHAIDITPKLRESVLRGQRAFSTGGEVDDDGITAYHGSPHDFDKFDISKIGTGEGAQAYGHGLYFAQAEPTAREYRDNLTDRASNFRVGNIDMPKWILRSIEMAPDRNAAIANHRQEFEKRLAEAEAASQGSHQPWLASGQKAAIKDVLDGLDALERGADLPHTRGRMYEVHINAHPDHFLDWDMPIYKQPEHVQNAVQKSLDLAASQGISGKKSLAGRTVNSSGNTIDADPDEFIQHDGASIQYMLQRVLGAKGATDVLHANGIKGIKYLDANSRTPPPNLDPDHVKRQIERNRAQAAQTIDEAHRADLDDDHQILLNRLAKAEKARARNYVVFDDKLVGVKRKYAYGGSVAA